MDFQKFNAKNSNLYILHNIDRILSYGGPLEN